MIIRKLLDGGYGKKLLQCLDRLKEMQFKDKLMLKKICLVILSKKDLKKRAISKDLKMQLGKKIKKFNS
jgi:hypothetical protein